MMLRALFFALPLLLAGCFGVSDIDDAEPCRNVGYSIASRTLDCTSDPELSNARFKAFQRATDCIASEAGQEEFTCAIRLNTVSCDEVEAYGDDIFLWLGHEPACAEILTPAGVARIGSSSIAENEVCRTASDEAYAHMATCAGGDVSDEQAIAAWHAEMNARYRCTARWLETDPPPTSDADPCIAELQQVSCSIDGDHLIQWLFTYAPSCADILEARE